MLNEFGSTYFMENKWKLADHWDDININEAVFILQKLHEKLHGNTSEAVKMICRLLLISFWTGRPAKDVLGFHFMHTLPKNPKIEGVYFTPDTAYFLIHISGPDLKSKIAPYTSTLPVSSRIQLKVPDSMLVSLGSYLIELSKTRKRQPLFKTFPSPTEEECNEMIRRFRDERFKRITLNRMIRFVPLCLKLEDGSDTATAGLILGSNAVDWTPRSNYTTRGKGFLTALYEATCKDIETHLNFIEEPPLFHTGLFPKTVTGGDEYVGSPYRPSQSELKAFIKSLVKNITD